MVPLVYLLCAATAFICVLLLSRGYRRNHTPLLLWASLCFIGLTANNILLYVDLVVVPSVDLALWRHVIALASLSLLVFGFIWHGTVSDGPGRYRSREDR
jgi:hypothetical protein